MQNSTIFVVTAVTKVDFSNINCWLGDTKSVGWFVTFQEAETAISNDIFNESQDPCKRFNWFIIEEIAAGCFKDAVSRAWYCWDKQTQTFKNIPALKNLELRPNIGIG